jgi:hypothetical protein
VALPRHRSRRAFDHRGCSSCCWILTKLNQQLPPFTLAPSPTLDRPLTPPPPQLRPAAPLLRWPVHPAERAPAAKPQRAGPGPRAGPRAGARPHAGLPGRPRDRHTAVRKRRQLQLPGGAVVPGDRPVLRARQCLRRRPVLHQQPDLLPGPVLQRVGPVRQLLLQRRPAVPERAVLPRQPDLRQLVLPRGQHLHRRPMLPDPKPLRAAGRADLLRGGDRVRLGDRWV